MAGYLIARVKVTDAAAYEGYKKLACCRVPKGDRRAPGCRDRSVRGGRGTVARLVARAPES